MDDDRRSRRVPWWAPVLYTVFAVGLAWCLDVGYQLDDATLMLVAGIPLAGATVLAGWSFALFWQDRVADRRPRDIVAYAQQRARRRARWRWLRRAWGWAAYQREWP